MTAPNRETLERERFGLPEAAIRLGKGLRWLQTWLREHPADLAGIPHYTPIGRTKEFTGGDLERIRATMRELDKEGFIYIVGYSEFVKIGFTTNIKKRLSAIQSSLPIELKTYCIFIGTLDQEQNLHRRFASFKLRGEWFRADDLILEYAAQMRAMAESIIEQRKALST